MIQTKLIKAIIIKQIMEKILKIHNRKYNKILVYMIKQCIAIMNKHLIKMIIKNNKVNYYMNKQCKVNMIKLLQEIYKNLIWYKIIIMKNLMKQGILFKVSQGLKIKMKQVVFKMKNSMKLETQFKVLQDLSNNKWREVD